MGDSSNPTLVEPGYTTTEFWLTLATDVIGLLALFNVLHFTNAQTESIIGLLALVVPNAIYIISRGIRKSRSV